MRGHAHCGAEEQSPRYNNTRLAAACITATAHQTGRATPSIVDDATRTTLQPPPSSPPHPPGRRMHRKPHGSAKSRAGREGKEIVLRRAKFAFKSMAFPRVALLTWACQYDHRAAAPCHCVLLLWIEKRVEGRAATRRCAVHVWSQTRGDDAACPCGMGCTGCGLHKAGSRSDASKRAQERGGVEGVNATAASSYPQNVSGASSPPHQGPARFYHWKPAATRLPRPVPTRVPLSSRTPPRSQWQLIPNVTAPLLLHPARR